MINASTANTGFRDALRLFQNEAAALRDPGPALETTTAPPEPPRVVDSAVMEGTRVKAIRIAEPPHVGFAAFLDGVQESRPVHYCDGIPIVFGRAAAVVRQRVLRRLVTWKPPATVSRFFIPRALVPASLWDRVVDGGFDVVDTTGHATTKTAGGDEIEQHPHALAQCAYDAMKRDRERLERTLAVSWCRSRNEWLFIDGSIAGSDEVASARNAVGVIKSHRTLYVRGEASRIVQRLPVNHRSSVLNVEAYHRTGVASWYVRVRDWAGRDPMWGLLRVETALLDRNASQQEIADHADQISRWLLAEMMPLSLPDSRWDKMVYGIYDCEEFLKSVRR